jgi:hypothetical protein
MQVQTQSSRETRFSPHQSMSFTNFHILPSYPAHFVPSFGGVIKLEYLPLEYQTEKEVAYFMEDVLKIGKVSHVFLQEQSAIIYFYFWYSTNNNLELMEQFYVKGDSWWISPPTVEIQILHCDLSWKDGTPMNQIWLSPVIQHGPLPKLLDIPEGEWTSLYIPMIQTDIMLDGVAFTAEHLQEFIENRLQIGKVRRIDLVDRDDLLQFNEKNPIQAAFIHMECWFDNYNTHLLRNSLNTKGEIRQRGYHDGKQMIKFTGKELQGDTYFRYFVFKINHKPIPDADGKLNIHQLSALKTKHEAELEEARAEIELLKAELENMMKKKEENEEDILPPLIDRRMDAAFYMRSSLL